MCDHTNLRYCHKPPNHHRTLDSHWTAMIVTPFDSQLSVLPISRHLLTPFDRVAKRFPTLLKHFFSFGRRRTDFSLFSWLGLSQIEVDWEEIKLSGEMCGHTNLRYCHKSSNHRRTLDSHWTAMIVPSFDSKSSVLPIPRHFLAPSDRVAKRFPTSSTFFLSDDVRRSDVSFVSCG
jgi:hypothetical protein